MAREVNLSSREWCDLVFEGKNKDFGAYVIRTDSSRRHNKAVLWTLIGVIIFGLLAFGYVKANQYLEERWLADQAGQEGVFIDITPDAEEPEPEQEILEQEKPEVVEEALSSVRVTELQIVDDEKVRPEDEILSQDEKEATDKVFGQTNVDNGQDDRMNFQTAVNEVVVEKPVEKVVEKVVKVPVSSLEGEYSDDLFFVIGKAEIRPEEAFKLGQISQILKENPEAKIAITGYADSKTGTAEVNRSLSQKRAQVVADMLIKAGIPASRITSAGTGSDKDASASPESNRVAVCIIK